MNREYKKKYFVGIEECINPVFPIPPYKGKYFIISFKNLRKSTKEPFGLFVQGEPSKHMVINTDSREKAQEASDLVNACLVVRDGADYVHLHGADPLEVKEMDENFKVLPKDQLRSSGGNNGFQIASFMAAKASFRNKYIYAIHKLSYSYFTISVPFIDLDPFHSENLKKPTIYKNYLVESTVAMATAIFLAYSAIEELGFKTNYEARNNPKKWRKERNKLLHNLTEAGVNIKEEFYWDLRGPKTFLERNMPERNFKKAEWARFDVRDEKIDITDAIANASFLRSKVCAHEFSRKNNIKMIKTLSIYDVTNTQHLARKLILESLKIWRIEKKLFK